MPPASLGSVCANTDTYIHIVNNSAISKKCTCLLSKKCFYFAQKNAI